MNVFLVFQWTESGSMFQGVFDNESDAEAACVTDKYCIAPAVMNERLPHEKQEWPGVRYPLASKEK